MGSVDTTTIEFTRDMLDAAIGFLIDLGLRDDEIAQILQARHDFARRGQQPHLLRLVGDDG